MSILSGFKKYKDYLKTDSGYQLMARWTKSDAVIMGNGTDDTNTLEKNLGAINGITDSLTATSSNIALSANAGNNLKTQMDTLNIHSMATTTTTISLKYNTFYTEINCNLIVGSPVLVTLRTGETNNIPTYYPVGVFVPSDGILRIIFNQKATSSTDLSVTIATRRDFFIDKDKDVLGINTYN